MRIFYSETGDPMLLGRESELQAFARELRALLADAATGAEFPADVSGDPSPYSEFLAGLRIQKAVNCDPKLRICDDRWLELTLTSESLERLCSSLAHVENGGHTHLYAAPLSLILEADGSWSGFNEV